jgi:ornithine cyclodeaminase/alanine dehydrogenase-like protein (mu-crystallin family)
MLILSRDDLKRVLDPAELFEALTAGFQQFADGRWAIPLRTTIDMPAHQGQSLFMPSYCEGMGAVGIKLVTVINDNPKKNLPLVQSKYLYVSAETGAVLSLMDGDFLTGVRTAVVSALVTDLLGKSGGGAMAVFGTGVQAWHHVEVFSKLFSPWEILVFGRTPERAEHFAERVERNLRKPSRRAVITELKRAEIICTCTTSPTPLFAAGDLGTGVHINAVGSYRPDMREVGPDVMADALIVVDSYESAVNEGALQRDTIYASIAELVSGSKALPDTDNRTTVFKSVGIALEDLVAADLAYRKAIELGIGSNIPM